MNPLDPPRLFHSPLGTATFKAQPNDFQVEEILGFEPSGDGEHCLLWVEKEDRNTSDVAAEIADRLGIRRRLVSHCGLKDRQAVTRQWFSLHIPGKPSPTSEMLAGEGVRVLRVTRNLRKLQRGSHDGNRFVICLRDCQFSKTEAILRWEQIVARGVPNYFGPQRFGHNGRNVEQGIRLLSGELDVRDRPLRGILLSAARSYLFNAFVGQRLAAGTWDRPLDGEVFGFANNRSLILPDNLKGDELNRFTSGTLELTSPLWGTGPLQSTGPVREIELKIADRYGDITAGLIRFGLRQERRVMRLKPQAAQIRWTDDRTLVLQFELPKGTYATTVLRELTTQVSRTF